MQRNNHQAILHLLTNTRSPDLRKVLLKSLPTDTIKVICEACYNILQNGTCHLSQKQWKQCAKYKTVIRALGYKPYYPIKHKRNLLVNQKGGFIGTILPIIASLIGGAIFGGRK